jgi:hypothetical protein
MHHHYDTLLGPLPKGPADLTQSDSAATDWQSVRDSIARGELEEIRGAAFYNRTSIITERYCSLGDGVDSLEGYLHSLWHMYYQLARNTSHETRDHDRIVLDIIRIQGLGPLSRPASGNYGIDIARTVEGTLWNDVPYLVTDMAEFWIASCASMSGVHRLNFASFLAKLASARVSQDRMCQIALILFRATFEERRELGSTEKPDHEDTHRSISSLDMAQLLPAACLWFREAGFHLVQLSDLSWNDCPSSVGRGGHLFITSEFGKRSPTGFTPWRWMYWLKRLHEIREEAGQTNEGGLEECATTAIDLMVSRAEIRNSGILRAYETGGDVLHQDPHLVCLKREGKEDTALQT